MCKGIIGWYENGGMNADRMVDFIAKFINGKFKNHLSDYHE